MLARVAAEGLDPECSLVVAVQHVLPGEADSAQDLDRALAGCDGRVAGVALRRRYRNRRLLVALGDAPRRPVGERARQLGLDVRVREPVRDRLVDTDRTSELLARLRMLDAEIECLLRDADGLERERSQLFLA